MMNNRVINVDNVQIISCISKFIKYDELFRLKFVNNSSYDGVENYCYESSERLLEELNEKYQKIINLNVSRFCLIRINFLTSLFNFSYNYGKKFMEKYKYKLEDEIEIVFLDKNTNIFFYYLKKFKINKKNMVNAIVNGDLQEMNIANVDFDFRNPIAKKQRPIVEALEIILSRQQKNVCLQDFKNIFYLLDNKLAKVYVYADNLHKKQSIFDLILYHRKYELFKVFCRYLEIGDNYPNFSGCYENFDVSNGDIRNYLKKLSLGIKNKDHPPFLAALLNQDYDKIRDLISSNKSTLKSIGQFGFARSTNLICQKNCSDPTESQFNNFYYDCMRFLPRSFDDYTNIYRTIPKMVFNFASNMFYDRGCGKCKISYFICDKCKLCENCNETFMHDIYCDKCVKNFSIKISEDFASKSSRIYVYKNSYFEDTLEPTYKSSVLIRKRNHEIKKILKTQRIISNEVIF